MDEKLGFEYFCNKHGCKSIRGKFPNLSKVYWFIEKPETIGLMLKASEEDKPALTYIGKDIEKLLKELGMPTDDTYLKQSIGKMVCSILACFGYKVIKRKSINKEHKSIFTTGYTYKKVYVSQYSIQKSDDGRDVIYKTRIIK